MENQKKNKQHSTMGNQKKTNNIQPWKTKKNQTNNIQPWKTKKNQTTFNHGKPKKNKQHSTVLTKDVDPNSNGFFLTFFAGNCLKFEHEDVCALNAKMTCSIVKTNI